MIKLHEEHVFVKNNNEYLTEKQMEMDPVLCVDFDFRYEKTVQRRQHSVIHIQNLIHLPYTESLMKLCKFPENCDEIKFYHGKTKRKLLT